LVSSHSAEAIMAGVVGYIRVSTTKQDAENQRHEILEYTNQNHLHVDEFIEVEMHLARTYVRNMGH